MLEKTKLVKLEAGIKSAWGELPTLPTSMPKKEARMLAVFLKEIRNTSTMKNASFYTYDADRDEKTEEIRRATKLWRESWIIAPLDDLIKRYENV